MRLHASAYNLAKVEVASSSLVSRSNTSPVIWLEGFLDQSLAISAAALSKRAQEIQHGLLIGHRQIIEAADHGIRFGRTVSGGVRA
jgi:hypothetical protein